MSASWRAKRLLASVTMDLFLWTVWILVVLTSLLLPLYLGVSLLSSRDCQPHLSFNLPPGSLSGLAGGMEGGSKGSRGSEGSEGSLLEMFIRREVTLELGKAGNVSIPVLPRQLLASGSLLVQQQVLDRYRPGDVGTHCRVGNETSPGPLSLGLKLCRTSLSGVVGDDGLGRLEEWLDGLEPGLEGEIVNAAVGADIQGGLQLLPRVFPDAGLNESHVTSLSSLAAPFSPSELSTLLSAARKADLTDKDMKVLEEVAKTSVDDLNNVEKVLKKINVTNLPKIGMNLDLLGIKLSDMISNPAIIFEFFGDEEKSAILADLQELLPKFRPSDVETFLKLQQNLEEAQEKYGDPEAPPLMSKLFTIPIDVLVSAVPKLKLDDTSKAGFDAFKLLIEDPKFELITEVGSQLLEPEAQEEVLQGCSAEISCRDEENDVCPMGHLFLGLLSLAPLLVPGLLYSLTTFLHYQGDIMQCGVGKPFKIPSSKLDRLSAWLILLPFYLLFMIPWTLIIIVYRQFAVWQSLVKEKRGGSRVEPDCQEINNASSFGILFGAGQGVPHLGIQLVLLGLLVVGGDVLLGLEQSQVTSTIWVSVASILLSCLVLAVSYLSGQEVGRLARDLSTPSSSLSYISTSLLWLVTATLVSSLSWLLQLLLLWVDTTGLTSPSWLLVSLLLLLMLPIMQCVAYQLLVREGGEQRFCWGMLAALIPVRFLDMDRRRARNFLALSQGLWLAVHLACWLVYSVMVQAGEGSDVVFRVWFPLVVPLLMLPPLTAALHWSVSLAPLYSSSHAHPDMADRKRRTETFPPDWRTLSGSSVRPDNLAEAGFFYSCRRLTTGEATCFSCGRQVTDWAGKTAAQAHRQATDHCPFYSQEKAKEEAMMHLQGNNVSCFAEFFFIAATLLFRIASFCLLLWVFMSQWQVVSPHLPTLYLIPPLYLLLLILLNSWCHFSFTPPSSARPYWALLSTLLPRPSTSLSLSSASQLLLINVAANTLVHGLLWAAMSGTCFQCSKAISMPALATAWPIVLVLGLLAVLSSIPYYFFTLKPSQPVRVSPKPRTSFVVSTAL